jgi:hypothetical protein
VLPPSRDGGAPVQSASPVSLMNAALKALQHQQFTRTLAALVDAELTTPRFARASKQIFALMRHRLGR